MFEFKPSSVQAARFDTDMQSALRDSVRNVVDQVSDDLPAALVDDAESWARTVDVAMSTAPAGFGAYYDFVEALEHGKIGRAKRLLREILFDSDASPELQIRRLGADYSRRSSARFQAYMGNGKTDASGIAKCPSHEARRFKSNLIAALGILAASAPDLYAEFQTLIREIILVVPDGSSDDEFEGGTCFKLWGALFLNAESEATPLQLAITLAHEEGHAVLFGACRKEMLVENPDEERFWSPIRQAERPLEGIFHATFVSARMAVTIREIQRNADLSPADRKTADQELRQALSIYEDGVQIVNENARFTATGKMVFDEMTKSMQDFLVDA